MKNYVKNTAARLMMWQAADNADTGSSRADFTRLYAIPFLLLFIVASTGGIFAAYFDYLVLKGIEETAGPPSIWPALIAIILQILIYATGAPVVKILANNLHKEPKHRAMILILAPITILSISVSLGISLRTKAAERPNMERYAKERRAELLSQQQSSHQAAATAAARIDSSAAADRAELLSQHAEAVKRATDANRAKIAEYRRKADKYKNHPAKWAQVLAESYQKDSTTAQNRRHAETLQCLETDKARHLRGIQAAASQVKTATAAADSVFGVRLGELAALQLSGAAADFTSAANFKQYRNIIFSVLSLLVLFALHHYYKRINQLSDNPTPATKRQDSREEGEAIDHSAAREIQMLKDRIRVQHERSQSSKTEEARHDNARKADANAAELFSRYNIKTTFEDGKANFF